MYLIDIVHLRYVYKNNKTDFESAKLSPISVYRIQTAMRIAKWSKITALQ